MLRLEEMEAGLPGISRWAGRSRLLGAWPGLPDSEGGSWGKKRSPGSRNPSAQEGRHNRGPQRATPPRAWSPAGTTKPPSAPRARWVSCSPGCSLSHVCLRGIASALLHGPLDEKPP